MESPDEFRRAAVDVVAPSDASAPDADEIIDLTDIVERGEIPAGDISRKDSTIAESGREKAEEASLDVLMADLRGSGNSDVPEEDLSSEFDLDSLLDAVVNQQDGRDGVSASVEEGPERVDTVSMANTADAVADDEEFDALLQDIVGDIEPSPSSEVPADDEETGEIGLDDLDSLLASLGDAGSERLSDESDKREPGEENPEIGQKVSSVTPPSGGDSSGELSMDELDSLLDSLEMPGADAVVPGGNAISEERESALTEKVLPSSKAEGGVNQVVFDASLKGDEQEMEEESGLADLDQLLDSLMANEPEKRDEPRAASESDEKGSVPVSIVEEYPEEMLSTRGKGHVSAGNAEKGIMSAQQAKGPEEEKLNLESLARELADVKTACDTALAAAVARISELESRLADEQEKAVAAASLMERLDAVDSRLDELGQALASERAAAEPDEEAIRTVVARELQNEGNAPSCVAGLMERLDAVDSRLDDLGQAFASERAAAEPDEEAIRTVVVRELQNEGNAPSCVTGLMERLDTVDSRLDELGQALASERAAAEPDEEAIRTVVVRELLSESNTPPYVEGMVNELVNFENRIITLESRLEKLEVSSEKAAAEAAARVIREEMNAMFAELGQRE